MDQDGDRRAGNIFALADDFGAAEPITEGAPPTTSTSQSGIVLSCEILLYDFSAVETFSIANDDPDYYKAVDMFQTDTQKGVFSALPDSDQTNIKNIVQVLVNQQADTANFSKFWTHSC